MKIRYLLDTDTFICIRNHRPPQVLKHFNLLEPGSIGISVITYGELIRGVERSEHKKINYEKLNQFVELIPVQTMSEETAIHYGEIRTALEKTGKVIGNNDLWIAAHARVMGVILITNNIKEFSRVNNLTLENWV